MLNIIDKSFEIIHLSVILFIITGWYFKRTRRVHLFVVLLTAFSWFIFGLEYGMGYCFLTDWHFQVKRELGIYNLPVSYIKYITDKVINVNSDPLIIDYITLTGFLISFIISIILNIREFKSKKAD